MQCLALSGWIAGFLISGSVLLGENTISLENRTITAEVASSPEGAIFKLGRPDAKKTKLGTLRMVWTEHEFPVKDLKLSHDEPSGIAVIEWKRGTTSFRLSAFASDADDFLVIHLLANKPGELGFRVGLEHPETKGAEVDNRREITLHGKDFAHRLWVWPMESEVEPAEKTITVRGEGEAILFMATDLDNDLEKSRQIFAARYEALGFVPGNHPDIIKLAADFRANHVRHKAPDSK